MSDTWFQEFRKPLNVVSLSVSAISLVFAVISIPRTQAPKKISYVVNTNQVISYSADMAGVGLLDRARRPVDGDVFVSEVTIWNSGSQAIVPADIHRPLRYELRDNGRILSVDKLAESEPAVTKMRASLDSDRIATFEWDNLDLKMGARFRITYISQDRARRLTFPAAMMHGISGTGFSSEISGFIKEGEIIDAVRPPRTTFYVGLILVLASFSVIAVATLTKLAARKTRLAGVTGVLDKAKRYLAGPLVVGFLMLLAALVYLLFFIGVPGGLAGAA
jgi:hypothetical protein